MGATPPGHSPLTAAVFHILLSLADGPLHGYRIMRQVEEESGITMGPGTVYGSLARLEETGWVQGAGPDESDARRRARFELTPAGRSALRAEALRVTRLAALAADRRLVPGDAR